MALVFKRLAFETHGPGLHQCSWPSAFFATTTVSLWAALQGLLILLNGSPLFGSPGGYEFQVHRNCFCSEIIDLRLEFNHFPFFRLFIDIAVRLRDDVNSTAPLHGFLISSQYEPS